MTKHMKHTREYIFIKWRMMQGKQWHAKAVLPEEYIIYIFTIYIYILQFQYQFFSILGQRQNGRYFADDIFKCIFLNGNVFKISLKFVPKGPIHNIPALAQIMAWCRPGDKTLSEPMIVSLLTHIASLGLNELMKHFLFFFMNYNRPLWNRYCSSHGKETLHGLKSGDRNLLNDNRGALFMPTSFTPLATTKGTRVHYSHHTMMIQYGAIG